MPDTIKIDLSQHTKRWNRVQVICAVALFFSCDIIASTLFDIAKHLYVNRRIDTDSLPFQIPTILLALFMVRQTWIHGSAISKQSLKILRHSFGIAAVIILLMTATAGVIIGIAAKTDGLADGDGKAAFLGLIGLIYMSTACIVVAVMIGWLQRSKIDSIGKTVRQLLDDISAQSMESPPEAYSHIRIDQPAGILWLILGTVIFATGAALGSIAWDYWLTDLQAKGNPNAFLQVSTLVEIAGVLLILKGRAYFTPRAEAVLAIDKRPPILYLRSFLDEAPDSVQWGRLSGGFVDRTLEMKIAKYFLPFGPFLAIGSPKDAIPKLGAMRLLRSDAEWQDEVKTLMSSAQLLVASVGSSRWIKWELAETLNRGFEKKSLFIFPVTIRRVWWWNWGLAKKQAAQQTERVSAMKDVYGSVGTPDYSTLEPGEFLLAQATTRLGTYLLTTRNPGSNSQVLSIIIGHYLLVARERST